MASTSPSAPPPPSPSCVLAVGHRYSINFAAEAQVEEAPLDHAHDLAVVPDPDEGPITITIDYQIDSGDREEFRLLMQEVQAACRRNGAFQCRLDESLDHPGLFRLEYLVSTWADHLRQNMRMTVEETSVFNKPGIFTRETPSRSCAISAPPRGSCICPVSASRAAPS